MQERYLGRVEPEMDVCDINGDKIGTVSHVYRHELAAVGNAAPAPAREELLEIKTGLLGLGKHIFVPMSAIEDVTEGCVFLSKSKDDFDSMGWYDKPSYLDEMA